MANLTETITSHLLEAAIEPDGLAAVLHRHSRSKGPLYHALAQATAELARRMADLRGHLA